MLIFILFVTEQGLSPYEKKKYVWKMLYIYMLGYDVDFGHMEAVSLISAPKYPEKQVCIAEKSEKGIEYCPSLVKCFHTFRVAVGWLHRDIMSSK